MTRSGQFILTVSLLASAGWLAYGLWEQGRAALTAPPVAKAAAVPAGSPAPLDPVPAAAPPEPLPLSDFAEMTARPLFSSSRRPPPAAAAGDAAAPESPREIAAGPVETSQYLVMGIVIAQDEKLALLKQVKKNNEIVRVKEGQKLSDWTVSEITPEAVTMQQDGVTDVVKLRDNILSAAEKKVLLQKAKLAEKKAGIKQKLAERRQQTGNTRRKTRQSARRVPPVRRARSNRRPAP